MDAATIGKFLSIQLRLWLFDAIRTDVLVLISRRPDKDVARVWQHYRAPDNITTIIREKGPIILMEINCLECETNPHFSHFRYLFGESDVIPVILLRSILFLVSIRIMSFSSLRDPSWRTNIAAPSDFNFTFRRIDVIGFAQEVQDLRIALIPTLRFRTSLFSNFSL